MAEYSDKQCDYPSCKKMLAKKQYQKWEQKCKRSGRALAFCSKECSTSARRGCNNPSWKGGTRTNGCGYVLVYSANHPNRDANNCVLEHRLVMEEHVGWLLRKEEVVHHKDGDKSNNALSNLVLFASNREHEKEHLRMRGYDPDSCSAEGCELIPHSRGLCKKHYDVDRRRK